MCRTQVLTYGMCDTIIMPCYGQSVPEQYLITFLCTHSSLLMQGFGQYEGSTLIAAGDINWNGRKDKIRKYADTLTIIGGNGVATGAQGTIVLAGGKNVKDTLSFDITLPK